MKAECIKRFRGGFQVPEDYGYPFKFKTTYQKGSVIEWKFKYSTKDQYSLETEDEIVIHGPLPHYVSTQVFLKYFKPLKP